MPLAAYENVEEVRVLGSIGVVQTRKPVNMAVLQKAFVEQGVWIRPFGRLIYVMLPYVTKDEHIRKLAEAVEYVLKNNLV